MRSGAPLVALLWLGGCTCGSSHGLPDAGAGIDAGVADAGTDAGADAFVPLPLPAGACEDVFEGGGPFECAPDWTAYCGEERCCQLLATCVDGSLEPGDVTCADEPVEPTCALAGENADVLVTVDGVTHPLRFAYADHGVGFGTYVDLTFTTSAEANVCTSQRLSISWILPQFDDPDAPAYEGIHDVTFQWTDLSATPRFRFFEGTVTITRSLRFREGGPVAGSLDADAEGFRVTGTFDAPECEAWRTSGS